ncbi:chloride channel protein [Calothrix sp. HK-06]|nr:chloride channel protein [Calothrix sp. HK-06]
MIRNPLTLSRWVLLWAALGIVCGLFASVYWIVLLWMTQSFERFSGLSLLLVMPFAGFLVGSVIYLLGNPGEIGLIIDNIHMRGGRLAMRENPSMILASLLSISSGGSAGPEAPMVQVTGSIGTWLADRLRLQGESLRSFSIAGMASGFTVLFGAPLGGAMFALEILHHQHVMQYYEAFLPAIVSSCAGYTIFVAINRLGVGPVWHFPQYQAENISDFAMAMMYGVVGAAIGWLFILIFRALERTFESLRFPIYLQTTLAGLGLGILAVFFPLSRYFGEHQIDVVIQGNLNTSTLLGLAVAKMLAISITVTGGWRGGIIIPLFFTGACVGKALVSAAPALDSVLAIICIMAALNAAVTRTPISTAILLAKLTGFSPLTPLLFASLVGFFLAPRLPFIASQLNLEKTTQPEP